MKKLSLILLILLSGCDDFDNSNSVDSLQYNTDRKSNVEHYFYGTGNVETKIININNHEYILAAKTETVSIIHSASCKNAEHKF